MKKEANSQLAKIAVSQGEWYRENGADYKNLRVSIVRLKLIGPIDSTEQTVVLRPPPCDPIPIGWVECESQEVVFGKIKLATPVVVKILQIDDWSSSDR